jgi:hypothetical protein
VFQSIYRQKLERKLSQKPCKQEIAKIPDWPRGKAVAEFRLCVGHDCLGTHLHRIGIRPDSYCMLYNLREPMDRNNLGQCIALLNRAVCERSWEARTKMMEIWLYLYSVIILCDYVLSLGLLYLLWLCFFSIYSVILTSYLYWSHRSMINNQCTCH